MHQKGLSSVITTPHDILLGEKNSAEAREPHRERGVNYHPTNQSIARE